MLKVQFYAQKFEKLEVDGENGVLCTIEKSENFFFFQYLSRKPEFFKNRTISLWPIEV